MSYYYSPLDEARIVGAFIWVIGIVGWVIVNLTTLIESFGQAVIRVAGITARGLEQFEQGRRKPSKMLVLPTQPVNPPSPTAVELANGIDITEHVTGIDIQWEANQ